MASKLQQIDGFESVDLRLTHSNFKSLAADVRISLEMSVESVKEKIWKKCGTSVNSMKLELYDDYNAKVSDLADNLRPLGFYSPLNGYRIHVIDLDPSSITSGGWLEDTSSVQKYTISEEAYTKRDGTFRKFKDKLTSQFTESKEDYNTLEVFAFELETKVASLEVELASVSCEKEELMFANEGLVSELEALTEKINISNSELNVLLEEVSALKLRIEESKVSEEKLENSIKLLEDSREELSMQLADSLLQMEEERAIWSAKEKACIQAMEDKAKLNHMEITSLSKELLEVRNELEYCREECKLLVEKLTWSEEIAKSEKENRIKCMNEWNNTEKAKLRMRLRGTQAQLDAYRIRYLEAIEESNFMTKKFEEVARMLKD